MGQYYAVYETKFGFFRIEVEDNKITYLRKVETHDDTGEKTPLTDQVLRELSEYFNGKRKCFDFPYTLRGTDFQRKVWQALCDIPYGETRSYKQIAETVGNPKAYRAVGMANNKNPIIIAVPCHRVIGTDGKPVGYAGGIDMKNELLHLEQSKG